MLSRAISFLQKRFPQACVMNHEWYMKRDNDTNYQKKIWPLMAIDGQAGIKQRMMAIPSLDSLEEFIGVVDAFLSEFGTFSEQVLVVVGNELLQQQEISSQQMTFSARVIFYIGSMNLERRELLDVIERNGMLAEIILEDELLKTVFISYGGPDEQVVTKINEAIKNGGAKTWFFPDDATPGDKLHRMMSEGVNSHDRVLLICSKDSLVRPGVLNEIERVLEREARAGGGDILIPIALDDFVYSDWCPLRQDIADQVRSRVIAKMSQPGDDKFSTDISKIIRALRITP